MKYIATDRRNSGYGQCLADQPCSLRPGLYPGGTGQSQFYTMCDKLCPIVTGQWRCVRARVESPAGTVIVPRGGPLNQPLTDPLLVPLPGGATKAWRCLGLLAFEQKSASDYVIYLKPEPRFGVSCFPRVLLRFKRVLNAGSSIMSVIVCIFGVALFC